MLDAVNRKMGRSTLKVASEGFNKPWQMKQAHKSPHYTTQWSDILSIQ
jgi:DNA polymerase V